MRLLLIGDKVYRERVKNIITKTNLTCDENIIELPDIPQAESFVSKNLILENKHIDLVIINDELSYNVYQNNFCDWIRSVGKEHCYSDSNFRISSIPIILLKEDIGENIEISSQYDAVMSLKDDQFNYGVRDLSQKVVKRWRRSILDDLDILNLNINKLNNHQVIFGTDYSKIRNNSHYYWTKTKVLSHDFIKFPKSLNYTWLLQDDLKRIEKSIYKYQKIIKGLITYRGRYFEREVLHAFYNKYNQFLLRDTYEYLLYEKHFLISSTSSYHIPDFVLTSPFPEYQKSSISEIKRHNILFKFLPKQHKNFTNYFQNALNQSSNYEDDFNNKMNLEYLNNKIGRPVKNFQVDLIVGIDEKMDEFVYKKINKHYPTLNIITHDQLTYKNEDFYRRSESVSIH